MRWVLAIVLAVQTVHGEEARPLHEMALDDILSYARVHAPLLREADTRVGLARIQVDATHWLWRALPTTTFSWGTHLGTVSIEEGALWEEQGSRMRWALHLNWSLGKLLGEGRSERRKAELGLQRALMDRDQAERLLVRRITQAWFVLEKLEEKEEVFREELAEKEKLADYNSDRYTRQRITYEEVSESHVQLLRSRLNVLECLQEQFLARQELMDRVGW